MERNPVVEGPLFPAVLRIAWPAAAMQLLFFLNNVVDFFWVQLLGPAAAAGQTAALTLFWMLAALGEIFLTGLTAVVARRVGERRPDAASRAAAHGLRGALAASVLVAAAGVLWGPDLAAGNEASAEARAYTADYLRTVFAGAPFLFFLHACGGVFRGRGDTRRPLAALGVAVAVNLVLDPILIHVAGLEVFGAALATVIAHAVAGALLFASALRRGWIELRAPGFDARLVARVVKIGAPVSVHGVVFSLVYVFLIHEVNRAGGDAAAAALGLGLRVEGFAYMTSVGCAAAAAAVVGQSLGAGDPTRAALGAWTAARMAAVVSGVWGLVLFVLPHGAVEAMSPGPASAAYATDYFRIVAVSLAFSGVEIALEGAFAGTGHTVVPMLLALPLTAARIPLAALLAGGLGWGAAGVFWAIAWTSVARGLLLAFAFARNRWVHGRA